MTHRLDADDLFIHRIQQRCAAAGLSFFLIEPLWVEHFYDAMQQGKVWSRVLLNMHSEHHQPQEIYHRLVKLAAQHHTRVIDPPDVAQAAFNKHRLHPRLIWGGIHVPYTVFVPEERAEQFQLTAEDRAALGTPFVVKPSMGYGRQGVILDATSEADVLRSRDAWPDTSYLLQRRIEPRDHEGTPAYFRVFHVFGSVWPCWWNCQTHNYRLATDENTRDLPIQELNQIVRRISSLTGMQFFSCEIAQTKTGQLVAIDYVNDQCHLLSQSANPEIGVPDALVTAIADRLVEVVAQMAPR